MRLQNNKYVIAIAYNNYQTGIGGVDKAVRAQRDKLRGRHISYLFLFPQLARLCHTYVLAHTWEVIADDKNCGLYTTAELLDCLQELQREHTLLQSITIHHLLNSYYPDLYTLLDHTEGKIHVFVHDYYTICPQYFLLKNRETFCGREGYEKRQCNGCSYALERSRHEKQIREFLERYHSRLELLFPSECAETIWKRAWTDIRLKVLPHQKPVGAYRENMDLIGEKEPVKIAFIGQQLPVKGFLVWKQLFCGKSITDLECYYLGTGKEKLQGHRNLFVSFQTGGKNAMTNALREYGIDCVLLWSLCPETYSYTYYECYSANVFILTGPDSGNIAAMVKRNGNGLVLENTAELERLLENRKALKESINQWRGKRSYGPAELDDQDFLYELETDGGILEAGQIKENNIIRNYQKILAQLARQMKKIIAKWFY